MSNITINNKKNIYKKIYKSSKQTHTTYNTKNPVRRDLPVAPEILYEIYQKHNVELPPVKAMTGERLRKCRLRIQEAVNNGNLEEYLEYFAEAVRKAQDTPFLRGEGERGWRADFDWLTGNDVNVYKVIEGRYDSSLHERDHENAHSFGLQPRYARKKKLSEPIYIPRQ